MRNFQPARLGGRISCDGRRAPRLPRRSLRPRLLPHGVAVHAASGPDARRDPPRTEAGQTRDHHDDQSTLVDAGHAENREGRSRLPGRARLQTIHDRRVSQNAGHVRLDRSHSRTFPGPHEDPPRSTRCSVQPRLRRRVQPAAARPGSAHRASPLGVCDEAAVSGARPCATRASPSEPPSDAAR